VSTSVPVTTMPATGAHVAGRQLAAFSLACGRPLRDRLADRLSGGGDRVRVGVASTINRHELFPSCIARTFCVVGRGGFPARSSIAVRSRGARGRHRPRGRGRAWFLSEKRDDVAAANSRRSRCCVGARRCGGFCCGRSCRCAVEEFDFAPPTSAVADQAPLAPRISSTTAGPPTIARVASASGRPGVRRPPGPCATFFSRGPRDDRSIHQRRALGCSC